MCVLIESLSAIPIDLKQVILFVKLARSICKRVGLGAGGGRWIHSDLKAIFQPFAVRDVRVRATFCITNCEIKIF